MNLVGSPQNCVGNSISTDLRLRKCCGLSEFARPPPDRVRMYSSTEFLKLIAENDFRLLYEKSAPHDVWIVTPEGKRVQMFEANGRYPTTLRIPKTMLDDFIAGALVRTLACASEDSTVYELRPDAIGRGPRSE